MDESLLNIDYVVISHGHRDHTGGLVPLAKLYAEANADNVNYIHPVVIAPPDAFLRKEYRDDHIGSMLDSQELEQHFSTRLMSEPL